MTSSTDFPMLEETWDMIDRSKIDRELFRKVWLCCELYLHSRGYTLAHPTSEAYHAIYAECLNNSVLQNFPQDPFHPQIDEAFCWVDDRLYPLLDPQFTGSTLLPTPSTMLALDSQGRRVVLKAVRASSTELEVFRVLSSYPLRADQRNHTIPVLEIIDANEWAIIVTPEWGFGHWDACVSLQEYMEFSRQLFEGLAFMHENGIIHGDIHSLNVVMNQLGRYSSDAFSPSPRNFGPCGAKYAFIDFSESHFVHTEGDEVKFPGDLRTYSDAPELLKEEPVNLFACDVYALGAIFKEHIDFAKREESQGIANVLSDAPQYVQLIDTLTHDDPQKRPTALEAHAQFEELLRETFWTNLNTIATQDVHCPSPIETGCNDEAC